MANIEKLQRQEVIERIKARSSQTVERALAGCVYFLLDCSGSMGDYNKLEQAKKGATDYGVEARNKGYAIGLIKFDSISTHLLEPQHNLETYEAELRKLSATGSTNLTAAIQEARTRLVNRIGERVIFIVTDGMPDNKQTALEAAAQVKANGIEIMTFGTDDADKAFLDMLATRKEFSVKMSRDQLQQGIKAMAKLLPSTNKGNATKA